MVLCWIVFGMFEVVKGFWCFKVYKQLFVFKVVFLKYCELGVVGFDQIVEVV